MLRHKGFENHIVKEWRCAGYGVFSPYPVTPIPV
jgi:hypothetical protein